MFFVTGDYSVTFVTADQLRIELKAGGLNQKQEDHVIGHILQSSETGEVGDRVQSSVGKNGGGTFYYNNHASLTQLMKYSCKKKAIFLHYLSMLMKLCVLDLKILELTVRFYERC